MSLSSMTGFGQAEKTTPSGNYRIEIRSVNNRFLDVQMRMSRYLSSQEANIKKLITSLISRGSVTVSISWSSEEGEGTLVWDKVAVRNYIGIFNTIKKEHSLGEEINLSHLLTCNDFIKRETVRHSDTLVWKHIKPILAVALADFQKSRQREGAFIANDLKKIVKEISKTVSLIEKRAPARLKNYSVELKKKIKLLVDKKFDISRLDVEIAIMSDKLDISEECTRMRAHIEKMNTDLDSNCPVGKRLNFILQEMNREANTIGSKANDTKVSHWSVALKESVEKIREQVLNIE